MDACAASGVNRFQAVLERHDLAAGVSLVRWHGLQLRVPLAAHLPEGHELE